jgi:nitrite reductase/ring-hydroxylating ferredoxin subunit
MRTRLCHRDEIPEQGSKGFTLGGENVFAVKMRGNIFVYQNSCPHIGIALDWAENQFLDSSRTLIQCANHGALFLIDSGKCVSGPCSGQTLTAVPFEFVDGYVELITSE